LSKIKTKEIPTVDMIQNCRFQSSEFILEFFHFQDKINHNFFQVRSIEDFL